VVVRKNAPQRYIEDRHAHIDLGTIVVSVSAAQQLGLFANITQMLDFLLNLIQFRFAKGRTDQLMPNTKFTLELHNKEQVVRVKLEGPANEVTKILTPKRIQAMLDSFDNKVKNDD
jgi:hypothetical protein